MPPTVPHGQLEVYQHYLSVTGQCEALMIQGSVDDDGRRLRITSKVRPNLPPFSSVSAILNRHGQGKEKAKSRLMPCEKNVTNIEGMSVPTEPSHISRASRI